MLKSRLRLWQYKQAFDVSAVRHQPRPPPRLDTCFNRPCPHKLFSTSQGENVKIKQPDEVRKLSRRDEDPWKLSAVAKNQKKRERAALRQPPLQRDVSEVTGWQYGRRDPSISDSEWDQRKKELQYLRDPLELANFVKQELRKDKTKEMLQLVRMASHSMQCIVSWNHIIDRLLANGRINEAFKVYNEMKKRAQFPDSYTYVIIFRGLSINAQNSGVLSKAIAVYHSLYAPNSRVNPSIMHTNAVLRVCARALDMDALWGVVGKIPEKGPAAPNTATYNTIINAIRQNLILKVPIDETPDECMARKERGITEGRRIWEEIVRRWRTADLVIDEELVCTMGRLLLIGSRPRDWDDVLSLLEQTMDIPRLTPRLGTVERHESNLPLLRAPNVTQEYRFDDDHLSPDKAPMRGDEFLPLDPESIASIVPNPLPYAQPGNNTLSVVQEACLKTVAIKAAQEYWALLTDPVTYNISPDINNLHNYLRNLRQCRLSDLTAEVLQQQITEKGMTPVPGTFRIAMSTCVRDKNNHNSFRNASQILNLMSQRLEDADSKVVAMYAELVVRFPLATSQDIVKALTVLYPIVSNIRIQLSMGGQRMGGNGVGSVFLSPEERKDAHVALQKVGGVYHRLLDSDLIPEEQKSTFKKERAMLTSFLTRAHFKEKRRQDSMAKKFGVAEKEDDTDLRKYLRDPAMGEEKEALGVSSDDKSLLTSASRELV